MTAAPVHLGTKPLDRARTLAPELAWGTVDEDIEAITRLKAERNAIVLAHNYMAPDIFHGVADVQGDSLGLARRAAETSADVIVMAGVHFMAETAKITCPDKQVLIPDLEAGCSLASSITAADVRRLKAEHPGVPVVTYVNTTAEVKAETDICCTSSNAIEVVESLDPHVDLQRLEAATSIDRARRGCRVAKLPAARNARTPPMPSIISCWMRSSRSPP